MLAQMCITTAIEAFSNMIKRGSPQKNEQQAKQRTKSVSSLKDCKWQEAKDRCEKREAENSQYMEFHNSIQAEAVDILPSTEDLEPQVVPLSAETLESLCHFRSVIISELASNSTIEEFNSSLLDHVYSIQVLKNSKSACVWDGQNLIMKYGRPTRKLNEGSCGTVYLLEHMDGRYFVMKLSRGDLEFNLGLASKEYVTTSRLSSKYVCKTLDILVSDVFGNTDVITIQEYFEGRDMYDTFCTTTLLHEIAAMDSVLKQLVAAVNHCHLNNVCHNDIKPENIMVSGDTSEVKLIDFGLALLTTGPKTHNNKKEIYFNGTEGYKPYVEPNKYDYDDSFDKDKPDVTIARIAEAKDMFSLGVVFYGVLSRGSSLYDECNMQDPEYMSHVSSTYMCPPKVWKWRSAGVYYKVMSDIVKMMLWLDERDRLTFRDLTKSAWYASSQDCLTEFMFD